VKYRKLALALAVTGMTFVATAQSQVAGPYESPVHVFSIDDLQTDFDGSTYGDGGLQSDPTAICGLPGGVACPGDLDPATGLPYVAPFTDKQGVMLYPVDSEFGFHVVDFLGAQPKQRDNDYREGFVGNIQEGGEVVGVKVSNAATDTYKVKPPLGTWCQGLGGTSVKCSTEHYVVQEHVLSCHEVVPYLFADPSDGEQAILSFPDGTGTYDCANAQLDDQLYIYSNGAPTGTLLTSVVPGEQMDANDNTTVLEDIAASADYSVTLKDDGKPLYRWGGLIKRPNDIRFYARIPLPEEWKGEDAPDYAINSAKLVVTHWITNNPNDQLRPEDLENEAATGRTPSYAVDGNDWISRKDCYEGDGDYLETEEGGDDPQALAAGTIFKNGQFANNPAGDSPPQTFSSDLVQGLTNAFYTTIDRDPFEWSYVDPDAAAGGVFDFIGSPTPLTPEEMAAQGVELVSGPRWRLKANKFGQDIPGLEIPLIECSAPPFTNENIRYEVGTPVTTVINLLDWDEATNGPSPLSSSKGWVDVAQNGFVTVVDTPNGPVTSNGLPMTEDFDLAVYIKGDRKSTALFTAQLIINEDEEPPVVNDFVTISDFNVWATIGTGVTGKITLFASNSADNPDIETGNIVVEGSDGTLIEKGFWNLVPGTTRRVLRADWVAPDTPQTVDWTATIFVDGVPVDQVTAQTQVF
jgi:hypothetical protein